MTGKRIFRCVLGGGFAFALLFTLTWLLERRLDEAGGEWGPAITAISTLVLAGLTAGYVIATYRLVDVQRQAPREVARLDATLQLSVTLSKQRKAIDLLEDLFPLVTSSWDETEQFRAADFEPTKEFAGAMDVLVSHVPETIGKHMNKPMLALWAFGTDCMIAWGAIIRERLDNLEYDTPWSEERIGADFEGDQHRPYGSVLDHTWEGFKSGESCRMCLKNLDELKSRVDSYLRE